MALAISFFMMPFLVRNLGDRMYGIWTLVGSVLGYYGLIDIGLSSAVVRFISRAVRKTRSARCSARPSTCSSPWG
jgi:O-antigen/teichoic acid export membrane protein